MEIKEQNEQRMVVAPSRSEVVREIIYLVIALVCILVSVVLIILVISILGELEIPGLSILFLLLFVLVGLVGLSVLLWILGRFIGSKITIDKISQTVTFTKRPFLLVHRKREILFSVVKGVYAVREKNGSLVALDTNVSNAG
ncbi:MAG TPA: hypothetical protein G4O10_02725 [Dehalococcoidia bacterium]|nr:hypothetical protein [Dehalococcoidia bacterium]